MALMFLGLMISRVLWSSNPGLAFVRHLVVWLISVSWTGRSLCASSRRSLWSGKEAHAYTLLRQKGFFEIICRPRMDYVNC